MKRTNPCLFNDNSPLPRKVVDVLTGKLRYRTPDEQRELARMKKIKNYWDTRSTERIRALRRERYRAKSRRKEKKTPTNPKGRRTDVAESPSVQGRRRHWAAVLREAKPQWSENINQEQARLLAAYHRVGSMRVPRWVKQDVYTYMERKYRQSGSWNPERGIFWEVDSATENSSEIDDSTDGSNSDELEDW